MSAYNVVFWSSSSDIASPKNSRDVFGSFARRECAKNALQPYPQNLNHVVPMRNAPRVGKW